jgi:hypothetical protein
MSMIWQIAGFSLAYIGFLFIICHFVKFLVNVIKHYEWVKHLHADDFEWKTKRELSDFNWKINELKDRKK